MASIKANEGDTLCKHLEKSENGEIIVSGTSILVKDPEDILDEELPEKRAKLEVTSVKLAWANRAKVRKIGCDFQNLNPEHAKNRSEESDLLAEERREKMGGENGSYT